MLQGTLLITEDTLAVADSTAVDVAATQQVVSSVEGGVGGLGGSKTHFTQVEATPFCAKPKEVEIFNLVVVALLIVCFLIATLRIVGGVVNAWSALFSTKKQQEIDYELTLRSLRREAALFTTTVALFAVTRSPLDFIIAVVFFILFFLARDGIFSILDYVNCTTCFRYIGRNSANYLTVTSSAAILLLIYKPLLILLVVFPVLFLIMEARVIFKNKFSLFFYILYLCTLEILPVALIVKLILR